eukprot:SAG31_NODE_910_length_11078_cov_25.691062_6_plen_78_part_00
MLATAKSNELSNCAQGLSWFTGRALDAVKCLGLSRCNKARAWEAGRHLHDAAYNNAAGSKCEFEADCVQLLHGKHSR